MFDVPRVVKDAEDGEGCVVVGEDDAWRMSVMCVARSLIRTLGGRIESGLSLIELEVLCSRSEFE